MKSLVVLALIVFAQISLAQTENVLPNDSIQLPRPEMRCECVDFVDEDVSFPGGMEALNIWVKNNVEYPESSREIGEQGSVYVAFVIETDGSISHPEVISGVSPELDSEALRLVRNMPKWDPALVKGKLVRSRCRVPISFKLT